MTSLEFTEWIAFANIEPIGELRSDLRAGIISAQIANAFRDSKKHSKPFTPADFMPDFDKVKKKKERQTPEQQLQIVEMLNAAFGGADLRKEKN